MLKLLINSYAYSYEKIKLMEFISEPEGDLTRFVCLLVNKNRQIDFLEIYIGEKLDVKATAEELKKNDILLARIIGLDSFFPHCDRYFSENGQLNLRYLVNGSSGRFEFTSMKSKKDGENCEALSLDEKSRINKFVSRLENFSECSFVWTKWSLIHLGAGSSDASSTDAFYFESLSRLL